MTRLLENVARARLRRAEAEDRFWQALRLARGDPANPTHSLGEIAGAAKMSRNGVYWHLTKEDRDEVS